MLWYDTNMKLIIVRHGETDKNRLPSVKGRDVPLNATGQRQAKLVAKRLAHETIDVVYSSDLLRARQTTETIIAQHPKVKVLYVKELRERDHGKLTSQSRAERESVYRASGQSIRDWRPEGGESLRDVKTRAADWLTSIKRQHPKDTVLVVSHGFFLYSLLEVAVEDGADVEREDFALSNGGLTVLEIHPEGRGQIVHLDDTSHLGSVEALPSAIKSDMQSGEKTEK